MWVWLVVYLERRLYNVLIIVSLTLSPGVVFHYKPELEKKEVADSAVVVVVPPVSEFI